LSLECDQPIQPLKGRTSKKSIIYHVSANAQPNTLWISGGNRKMKRKVENFINFNSQTIYL